MSEKILQIVIADDNKFFCEALQDSLNQHKEFNVLATFNDLHKLIEYTNLHSFDVLILDINFNGESSLDYLFKIKTTSSNFKIISLSTLNNNYIKNKALENGVNVFIGKDSDLSQFKDVILNCFYADKEKKRKKLSKIKIDDLIFTKRKIEILQAFFDYSDKTEKELSEILHISESAIKSHKQALFELTNSSNTQELIKFGIKKGLIIA